MQSLASLSKEIIDFKTAMANCVSDYLLCFSLLVVFLITYCVRHLYCLSTQAALYSQVAETLDLADSTWVNRARISALSCTLHIIYRIGHRALH